jgi:tight adherence protein C
MSTTLPFIALGIMTVAIFTALSVLLGRVVSGTRRRKKSPGLVGLLLVFLDLVPVPGFLMRLESHRAIPQMLLASDMPASWTVRRLLAAKVLFILCYPWFMIWIAYGDISLFLYILYGLTVYTVGWRWPELFLARRQAHRKKQARKTLPYLLDLMQLQVNAGLNLESAIRGIAPTIGGTWRRDLEHLVFLIDRGTPFPAALKAMAQRVAIEDFDRFVLAVSQSRVLGASLSETLQIQAEMLRTRRRQRAEEQARVASVKIAIPLVFFIFPAMMIVYLAPAVLRILEVF